jgi:HEAT repeat protein
MLEDLLKHHLIQVTSHDQIEFCHQLIQEYYAAEILLQMLLQKPSPLNDETLKREYLNYLKWTEPLALMLELVEDETLAVQVVKLALKVDLRLGARLAGAVKPKFQEKTIDLVTIQEISQQLKMLLLGITHSHIAINILFQALEDRDYSVRWFTTEALGQIVSEATIPGLRRAIQDEDNEVRWAAFNALEKIGTEAIIPPLIQASKDENTMICEQAIYLLGDIAGEAAIPYLIEALAKEDNSVRGSALCILGQICGKNTIPELIQDLEDRGFDVHSSAFSVIRRWRGIAFLLDLQSLIADSVIAIQFLPMQKNVSKRYNSRSMSKVGR